MKPTYQLFLTAGLIILCCFSQRSFGQGSQPEPPDTVSQTLAKMPEDTLRVDYLNDIAYQFRHTEPVKAIDFATRARDLARKLDYPKGEAESLDNLAETAGTMSRYPDQLDYLLESLRIKQEMGDEKAITRTLNGLGNFHFMQQNYDEALKYYHQTIKKNLALGNRKGTAGAINNIGSVLINQGELDSAMTYFQKALEINRESGKKDWESINLGNIGLVHTRKNNDREAIKWYKESLNLRTGIGNKRGASSSHRNLALSYRKLKMYPEAESSYREALRFAQEIESLSHQHRAFTGLANLYEDLGQNDSTVKYLRLQIAFQDSIFGQENAEHIADAEKRYETERLIAEKEVAIQTEKIKQAAAVKQQKLIRNFAFVGAGLIAILFFLLFFRYREKRKANELLEEKVRERTRDLEEAQEELNTFIYRSSHDLRSPLTSIQGILEITRDKTGGEVAEMMGLIGNRVTHLTAQLEKLIDTVQIREGQSRREKIDWQALVGEVAEKLSALPGFAGADLRVERTGDREFHSDPRIVSLILRNLLDNSIHYRDPGKTPQIIAKLNSSNGQHEIIIEDNGEGMSETVLQKCTDMFYRGNARSTGSGLGLYTVRKAVKHLDGRMEINSEPGKGTKIRIILPDADPEVRIFPV